MRQIRIIKGKFTKEYLEGVLGEPSWEWVKQTVVSTKAECGLAIGSVWTAGWGDASACGRVWIHKDGICFAPGLNIREDIKYTEAMYQRVKENNDRKESNS